MELLNHRGHRPANGKQWHRQSVRNILTNQKYCGVNVWGVNSKGKYNTHKGGAIVQKKKKGTRKQAGKSSTVDTRGLKKRLSDLERMISNGAERILNAPASIVDDLYTQLDKLKRERDEIQKELSQAVKPRSGVTKEVEKALKELATLNKSFETKDPYKLREVLSLFVDNAELKFKKTEHKKRAKTAILNATVFARTSGTIHVPANPNRSVGLA